MPSASAPGEAEGLARLLRQVAARVEVASLDRAAAARAAVVGWEGAARTRFDHERIRQTAHAGHLAAQARRLAAELETRP